MTPLPNTETTEQNVIRCNACGEWYQMHATKKPQEHACGACGCVWFRPPVCHAEAVTAVREAA